MHTYDCPLFIPWSASAPGDEVARRAGGRRYYNSMRQLRALLRRGQLIQFLHDEGRGYGDQARAARRLGVSAATISRDMAVAYYLAAGNPARRSQRARRPKPVCSASVWPYDTP